MNNQLLDTRKSLIHQSLKSKKGKNLIEIHTNRGGKSNQNRRQNGDGQRGELGKEGDSLGWNSLDNRRRDEEEGKDSQAAVVVEDNLHKMLVEGNLHKVPVVLTGIPVGDTERIVLIKIIIIEFRIWNEIGQEKNQYLHLIGQNQGKMKQNEEDVDEVPGGG